MIKKWLNKKNISLWKLFDYLPAYKAKVGRGNHWVSFVQTFIPLQYIIPLIGAKLALLDKWPIWIICLGGIAYSILMEVVKFIIGHFDMKYGVWERESLYNQTKKEIAPFNNWVKENIQKIKDKLEIK